MPWRLAGAWPSDGCEQEHADNRNEIAEGFPVDAGNGGDAGAVAMHGEGRKQKLAEKICLELSVHAAIEEEIFYPACEGKVDEDLLKESYVEHDAAKLLIAEISAGSEQSDDFFDSKVKVLQEEIEHHVE